MENQYCGFSNLRRLMDDHFSDHGSATMMHLIGGDLNNRMSGPKPEALSLPLPPSMVGTLLEDNGITTGYQQGRWPRQETLTLLEIRSRLDPKFKESAHKAPLWDEISRIMAEEYGYQRSGKKCREKIENLYKYYKKTKEGKAGRQDGRHYRFFRQLESLYGESNNNNSSNLRTEISIAGDMVGDVDHTQLHIHVLNNTNLSTTIATATSVDPEAPNEDGCNLYKSLELNSDNDEMDVSSDDSGGGEDNNKGRSRIRWETKMKDFVDQQVKKFTELQDAWLEKMLKALERSEQERIYREEQWRKKETARLNREQEQWAHERSWIEARDLALVEVLGKVISARAGRDKPTTIVRKRNKNNQRKRKGMMTMASSSSGALNSCFDYLEDDDVDDDGIEDEEEEEDRKVEPSRPSGSGAGIVDCDEDGRFRFLIERLTRLEDPPGGDRNLYGYN